MTAAENLLKELTDKARVGWELNGYRDGLADRFITAYGKPDSYMVGWREGEQVRLMLAAAEIENPFAGANRHPKNRHQGY